MVPICTDYFWAGVGFATGVVIVFLIITLIAIVIVGLTTEQR